ncbi:MAG TPA: beta-ketoacyl-ACP synthase II [Candidatus Binataceae bacterium]|nr:beta-ketoacyl-ACP synthase II [Candidatus Binataceae bacterium]
MRRMLDRRVVVTGLGLVTPLGTGVEKNWEALTAGRSGAGPITKFDASQFPVRIAAEVKDFNPEDWIEKRDIKKMDPFIQYVYAAAAQAMDQSGYKIAEENADAFGVLVGVGIGGLTTVEETHKQLLETGSIRHLSPFFIPKLISNLGPGHISIRYGARGPTFATTSACASGSHAIGETYRMIKTGIIDAGIVGGTEAAVTALGVGGFIAMRALSTRNDDPARASRPFDKDRNGFLIAEGGAALVIEEREAAIARGAKILAEICGYGANSDAHHITSPAPEGRIIAKCMSMCLTDYDLDPNEVDYINAHGTSTEQGDIAETQGIKRVFGERAAKLAVSSTKSMTGHTLGAAGAIESVFTVLAVERGIIPPTINLDQPDPQCDLDYVPNTARPAKIRIALNNSFGFGGTNTTLAFRAA